MRLSKQIQMKMHKVKDCPTLPVLDTDAGRRQLLTVIEKRSASLQASSASPKMKQALTIVNKARGLLLATSSRTSGSCSSGSRILHRSRPHPDASG